MTEIIKIFDKEFVLRRKSERYFDLSFISKFEK